jgi:hypothetical protein
MGTRGRSAGSTGHDAPGTRGRGSRSPNGGTEGSSSHSGKLLLRMPPELHTELARVAEDESLSLNQFISNSLADAVDWNGSNEVVAPDRKPTPPRPRPPARAPLPAGAGAEVPLPAPVKSRPMLMMVGLALNFLIVLIAAAVALSMLVAAWQT